MDECKRKGNFRKYELHVCFQCYCTFFPGNSETCKICNWKKCVNGHCGCTVSQETKKAIDTFYDLFCNPNINYSQETKNALYFMLNTYWGNCL